MVQTDPVVAAAGDIACDPLSSSFNNGSGTASSCHMKATADIIAARSPTAVFTLGDNQYENGGLTGFMQSYDPSWGPFKTITHPTIGNHEYYGIANPPGYFSYFGAAAGEVGKGYYSLDIGAWHAIVLNSNCGEVGGCGAGSPQELWLKADLRANAAKACVVAMWHHPRFSSGVFGSDTAYQMFFQDLYEARADLLLVGHSHTYERFAPQNPDSKLDEARGVREFVVGTGGKDHTGFAGVIPNSEVRDADTFGVLIFTLHPSSYDWEFVPERGGKFTDKGSGACVTKR